VVNEELSTFELQQLLNKALAEIERLRAQLLRYQQEAANGDGPPAPAAVLALEEEEEEEEAGAEAGGEGGDSADRSGSLSGSRSSRCSRSGSSSCSSAAASGDGEGGGEEVEEEDLELSRTQLKAIAEERAARDEEAWTAMEIELARLRALLADKDEETAQLSLVNVELRTRLKEEAAAMATSLEEQRILEARLREAEANLDQMMRATAAASAASAASMLPTAVASVPQEEASVRAVEVECLPRRWSLDGELQPFSPRSPSAQQVYEEKLQSVEKVCSFLQDELENQRVRGWVGGWMSLWIGLVWACGVLYVMSANHSLCP
jgi:hypothetical protein